jgi:threonine/homoserine/homoserine lactone efflux protein
MSFVIQAIIQIIAKNPPSILFVLAFLSLVLGYRDWAVNFAILGVVLQVLWLVLFSRRR